MVNADKVLTRQLITTWYERAKIDYSDLYVKEYIAYNAWFRKVTQCREDHEAIRQLQLRFVIWDDYLHGRTMAALRPVLEQIAVLTSQSPIRSNSSAWNGIVEDVFDWRGLIYFWYQTRSDLFHGLTLPGKIRHDTQIKYAYESLNIFMAEIVHRMRYCFTDVDLARLKEVRLLLQSDQGAGVELKEIESRLYQKFLHAPDMWNVDMQRV